MELVTSIGGPYSNSTVTLEEAESILGDYIGEELSEEWTNSIEGQQVLRLITGIQVLGMLPLKGHKSYLGQALCTPRSYQVDQTVYPEEFQICQVLLAYDVVGRAAVAPLNDENDEDDLADIGSFSFGGLSVSLNSSQAQYQNANLISKIIKSSQFPIFAIMKPHLASIRVRSFRTAAEREADNLNLLTYVEEE